MSISSEWTKVLDAHCHRVIESMSLDELKAYAHQMKRMSFDASFGDGDTILDDLIEDVVEYDNACGEGDKTSKVFLIDCGISEELADETLKYFE
jgi:hypothetical protein